MWQIRLGGREIKKPGGSQKFLKDDDLCGYSNYQELGKILGMWENNGKYGAKIIKELEAVIRAFVNDLNKEELQLQTDGKHHIVILIVSLGLSFFSFLKYCSVNKTTLVPITVILIIENNRQEAPWSWRFPLLQKDKSHNRCN